jgi:hypothetical protein
MKNVDKLKYHYQKLFFDELPEDTKLGVFIGGGAIREYLSGGEIKDIDVFTDSKEAEDKVLAFFKDKGKLLNENAMLANYTYKDKWFQVIKGKYYKSGYELIDSFDFTICQAALGVVMDLYPEENRKEFKVEFLSSGDFFQDALAKHLRINKITFPLSTLERLQKYIQKGYTACNGTLLEVAKSMKDVDFDNKDQNTLVFYPSGGARFFGVD